MEMAAVVGRGRDGADFVDRADVFDSKFDKIPRRWVRANYDFGHHVCFDLDLDAWHQTCRQKVDRWRDPADQTDPDAGKV